MSSPKINYELKTITEKFQTLESSVELKLEVIADLDRAIDAICEELPDHKDPFALDLCPYFGVIWPAARALSEHLAKMGSWLNERTVLEIGCGLALPSLVAAKLGAKVIATDFHPDVVKFLEKNTALNDLNITYKNLHWKTLSQDLGKFDFVIASDVLYENEHPKLVAEVLNHYCKKDGHIILSDPGRTYLQACVDELKNQGYQADFFVREGVDQKGENKEIFLFSFFRK